LYYGGVETDRRYRRSKTVFADKRVWLRERFFSLVENCWLVHWTDASATASGQLYSPNLLVAHSASRYVNCAMPVNALDNIFKDTRVSGE